MPVSPGDIWFGTAVIIAALIGYAVIMSTFPVVTIHEYQRGLRYVRGRFSRVLEPGQYRFRKATNSVAVVDMRQQTLTLAGQEVLTADGVGIRVSIAARFEVIDPARATNTVDDYQMHIYQVLQIGLRDLICSVTIDDLMEKRADLGSRLMDASAPAATELGLHLISADVKDIMLPGESRKLFTQIVKARKEGQAALERARGETAALRSLANAARLMEDHPSLLQLRALQQLTESSGNTIVLGLPSNTTTLPISSGQTPSTTPPAEIE